MVHESSMRSLWFKAAGRKLFSLTVSAVVVFSLMFLGGVRANAQVDTGTISGTIFDQSGAVVPKAKVTLTNLQTNFTLTATSGSHGEFTFSPIRIGTYMISAQAPGFSKVVQKGLRLQIQQSLVINLTLHPGAVTQQVQVTTAPPLLQTQSASVGTVVGSRSVNNLPLNGRNFFFLAQLVSGVGPSQPDSRGNAASGTFSANGAPPDQNNYLLDGIDDNSNLTDFVNGTTYVYKPSIDAINEFKVQTSDYSAQFGRSAGAVLNVSIKSGTNKFHGDAYEFLRNSSLDAANFFENAAGQKKGAFRQNQFGATLGGPLSLHPFAKNHSTFFFGDYEGLRVRQQQPFLVSVPTLAERSSGYQNLTDLITGQASTGETVTNLLGQSFPFGTIFDPATTRPVTQGVVDPVTNLTATGTGYVRDPIQCNNVVNMLCSNRIDPNAVKLLNLFPLPTNGNLFNNYSVDQGFTQNSDQGDLRIDHDFSDRDTVFGRVSMSHNAEFIPGPFQGLADGGAFQTGTQGTSANNDVASWTHIFSPTLVNEFRFGYARINTSRVQPDASNLSNVPAQFGIQGIPQVALNGGIPTFGISGLSQLGSSPWKPTSELGQTTQITDNLTKIVGNHQFKGGFEFQHVYVTFYQPAWSRGEFDFNGAFTELPNQPGGNTGRANFLLTPIPTTVPGGVDNVGGATHVYGSNIIGTESRMARNYYAGYFQDDWKVSQKLTLNLGLRWSYIGHAGDTNGYNVNWLPNVGSGGSEYIMTDKRCKQGLSPNFTSLLAKDNIGLECMGGLSLLHGNKYNFSPRVGFAYEITPKLVVRSGFGIFYGTPINGDTLSNAINYPHSYTIQPNYNGPNAPITYPNGSVATIENGLSSISFDSASPNFNAEGIGLSGAGYANLYMPTAYTEEYNLTLEYQLGSHQTISLGYVGNVARHLNNKRTNNAPSIFLPPGTSVVPYKPFPDFGGNWSAPDANSIYNSLQLTYQRRFSDGLSFLGNYTYGQCRTDNRSILNNTISGYRAPTLPGFGIQGDYALCDYNYRNIWNFSGGYQLPFGHGKSFMGGASGVENQVVGGWSVHWILSLHSGTPFTIPCNTSTSADYGCNALLVPGQNIHGNGDHNVNHWLNGAAFSTPPTATLGQSSFAPLGGAPTQATGPGYRRLTLSIFKEFPIREQTHLEFRAEIFNVTNTPAFGLPGFGGSGGSSIGVPPGVLDYKSPNFGAITSTVDGAQDQREIQFALKLYF